MISFFSLRRENIPRKWQRLQTRLLKRALDFFMLLMYSDVAGAFETFLSRFSLLTSFHSPVSHGNVQFRVEMKKYFQISRTAKNKNKKISSEQRFHWLEFSICCLMWMRLFWLGVEGVLVCLLMLRKLFPHLLGREKVANHSLAGAKIKDGIWRGKSFHSSWQSKSWLWILVS